jgi:hypothetical protein
MTNLVSRIVGSVGSHTARGRLGVVVAFSCAPGPDPPFHITATTSGAATQSIIGCSHGMRMGSRLRASAQLPRRRCASTETRSLRSSAMTGASVEREFISTYVLEGNGYSVPDKFQDKSDTWSRHFGQMEILSQ